MIMKGGMYMNNIEIYDYILSRVQAELLVFGYSRSGKSGLFYRYSADKKVGCVIEMQKSAFNYPGSYSFTFNLGCIALYNLRGYNKEKLTLSTLKLALTFQAGVERIGILCRGTDYWWDITDEIMKEYSLEEYYDRFIQDDIKKCAAHLDELAAKKEEVYSK